MNFDLAFEQLIGNEGGYVNDPRDPGGETKYGISKRSYPGEDIKNLTLDRAKELYKRDFWGPAGCDAWPDPLKFQVFDIAVNTSQPGNCKQAVKFVQRSVGAADDGVIGPQTLMKVQSADPRWVLNRTRANIILFYAELKNWSIFSHSWMVRLANNMLKD